MQELVINEVSHEITDRQVEFLRSRDAIYFCDDHEAWHLTPDHSFELDEVECLMSAELD